MLRAGGVRASSGPSFTPVPLSPTATGPGGGSADTSATSDAPTAPAAVGANATSTLISSPAARAAGSAREGPDTVNCGLLEAIAFTVTARLAVNVTEWGADVSPLSTRPNGTLPSAASGMSAGDPKPRTMPSRVPT